MRILVTLAVEEEFAPWRRLRDFCATRANGYPVYEARIQGADVRVVLTGVGPDHARRVARLALSDPPNACISSGLAGSLRPEHPPGAILAAREVCESRSRRVIQASPGLLECARRRDAKVVNLFLTADRVVVAAGEKRELGGLADAVEMESFPVLAEACARGVRAVAIRAVGDAMDQDLPIDFNGVFDARGRLAVSRLAGRLVLHPSRLPAVVRFGRAIRSAATRLVTFLDAYVRNLPEESSSVLLEPALEVVAR